MKVASRILVLVYFVALASCSSDRIVDDQRGSVGGGDIWRASIDAGDKPGNGIEIVRRGGAMTARFFLLEPEKPHDFSAGIALPTKMKSQTESELRILVTMGKDQVEELIVRIDGELEGDEVPGSFYGVDDLELGGEPIPLKFVRQRQ